MGTHEDILERIDEIETEVRDLGLELHRLRGVVLAERTTAAPPATVAGPPARVNARPAAPAPQAPQSPPAATPPSPPAPPRRSFGELAREWDLLGPRGF